MGGGKGVMVSVRPLGDRADKLEFVVPENLTGRFAVARADYAVEGLAEICVARVHRHNFLFNRVRLCGHLLNRHRAQPREGGRNLYQNDQ